MIEQQPQIVLVSHASGLCGAERSLLDLLDGLEPNQCIVILPSEGPLTQALAERGVDYTIAKYHAWVGRKGKPLRAIYRMLCNIWQAFWLARKLGSHPIQLVYVNTTTTPFGSWLARFLKVPCVWHVREWLEHFDFGIARSLKVIGTSKYVLTNSNAMAAKLASFIEPEKLRTVYNGPITWQPPTLRQKPAITDEKIKLCVAGTIYENKGFIDAVRAIALLKKQGVLVQLDVIGDGREEDVNKLKAEAETLGVGLNVVWHGFVEQPLPLIAASHICLVCSRQEAFGRVAVEAMSMGTPVVSTAVGGLLEIITDGETGLFYSPGDVESLANQILKLIHEPKLYVQIQKQGMTHVYEHFTAQRYQQHMKSIFEQV